MSNIILSSSEVTMSSRDGLRLHIHGYVYACKYSDGTVKVGISEKSPSSRIAKHDSDKAKSRVERTELYISPKIVDPREIERQMIEFLSVKHDIIQGREWFSGGCIDEISSLVEGISYLASNDDAKQARDAALKNKEKAEKIFAEKLLRLWVRDEDAENHNDEPKALIPASIIPLFMELVVAEVGILDAASNGAEDMGYILELRYAREKAASNLADEIIGNLIKAGVDV